LAAPLALGAHALAGGAALFDADRAVAVGINPREQGKGAGAGFLARHAAVAIDVGLAEHAAAEAREHAAASAAAATLTAQAATLGASFKALGTIAAAEALAGIEFGAADLAVAVDVELGEALGTALAALRLACTAGFAALATARLGDRAGLFLGDEAVAVGIDAGEAGIDTLFNQGTGQRLRIALALSRLGQGGGGAEHGKSGSGKNERLHEHAPVNWGKNLPRKQALGLFALYVR
jgi:hypothetical protein